MPDLPVSHSPYSTSKCWPKRESEERNLGSRVRRVFLKGSFRAPNPPNSQWVLKGGANSGWIWVNVFLNIGGGLVKGLHYVAQTGLSQADSVQAATVKF